VGRVHLSQETEFEVIRPVVLTITTINITFKFLYTGWCGLIINEIWSYFIYSCVWRKNIGLRWKGIHWLKAVVCFCIKTPLHDFSALCYMWYDIMCHIKNYTTSLTIADDLVALLHHIPELLGWSLVQERISRAIFAVVFVTAAKQKS